MLALGLGISPPWKLVAQRLDAAKRPKELHIELAAERGALFPCPDHGVKRIQTPWAREGSRFTLLFEQAALMLARENCAAAR